MRIAERIVQPPEIRAAHRQGYARLACGVRRELVEVREAPGARREEGFMAQLHGSGAREPLSRPDGEYERLSGPVLPLFTEIVAMRICPAGHERERGVTDHEHCVMGQCGESVEILGLGVGCGESRLDLPHVTTQELEQRDGRPR